MSSAKSAPELLQIRTNLWTEHENKNHLKKTVTTYHLSTTSQDKNPYALKCITHSYSNYNHNWTGKRPLGRQVLPIYFNATQKASQSDLIYEKCA